ncbi:hypothetical protein [Novipirellula sp.]|uniref:hypothetical protein n=1 Tax=Novipirellula sp. TaxID=2795430 RepID=UPI003565BECE
MVRAFLFICTWFGLVSLAGAQGLATNAVERSAVQMLIDFVASPTSLPDEYAVVLRETQVSYIDGTEGDTVYLFAEDRRRITSTRFSAKGYTNSIEPRRWVQYLRTPTHRAQRQGGQAFGRFAGEVVEDVTMDPEDSQILQYPQRHDFVFFRPVAPRSDRSSRKTQSAGYGRLLLDELDFMGAEKLDDGKIQSDWARKLWRVQITFDPKQGNRPTKIIHFSDLDIENPGPIVCVHVIDWEEWKLENNTSMWIPSHFRFRHSTPAYKLDYETAGHLRWADTSEESVMPELQRGSGNDWREKIRERFSEDWQVRHAEWLNTNQRKDGTVPAAVD